MELIDSNLFSSRVQCLTRQLITIDQLIIISIKEMFTNIAWDRVVWPTFPIGVPTLSTLYLCKKQSHLFFNIYMPELSLTCLIFLKLKILALIVRSKIKIGDKHSSSQIHFLFRPPYLIVKVRNETVYRDSVEKLNKVNIETLSKIR